MGSIYSSWAAETRETLVFVFSYFGKARPTSGLQLQLFFIFAMARQLDALGTIYIAYEFAVNHR